MYTLRYDGLYASREDDYTSYLRFTAKGEVFQVGSEGSAKEVARWLGPKNKHISRGKYIATIEVITFTTVSREGKVKYGGTISPDGKVLVLVSYSLINNYTTTRSFEFIHV